MAGIAGVDSGGKRHLVLRMLERIAHRGRADSKIIIESPNATLGAIWPQAQVAPASRMLQHQAVWDGDCSPQSDPVALQREQKPFALAVVTPESLFLARDVIGVRPLYYGRTAEGALCFASEVKALLEVARDIHEFPPGYWYDSRKGFHVFAKIEKQAMTNQNPNAIASELRLLLEQAVCRRAGTDVMGCWLSGGLDSSAMTALMRPHVRTLHTFSAGMSGAPDLKFASQVADFLNTHHHEIIVTLNDLLAVLPEVIYHLESFDALLLRSSLTNYLVGKQASEYVDSVLSGEGADELFAGYDYLKALQPDQLADELADITQRLHNTALQRVDRSAGAHGLVAHVPFLDSDVVDYAMRIPPQFKLRAGGRLVEKWILRQALTNLLPDEVLWRSKAKFWQGSGVGELLAEYAEQHIEDDAFSRERTLPNGWILNTKEELMYYRIFRDCMGEWDDLSWMGRTKGAPLY